MKERIKHAKPNLISRFRLLVAIAHSDRYLRLDWIVALKIKSILSITSSPWMGLLNWSEMYDSYIGTVWSCKMVMRSVEVWYINNDKEVRDTNRMNDLPLQRLTVGRDKRSGPITFLVLSKQNERLQGTHALIDPPSLMLPFLLLSVTSFTY